MTACLDSEDQIVDDVSDCNDDWPTITSSNNLPTFYSQSESCIVITKLTDADWYDQRYLGTVKFDLCKDAVNLIGRFLTFYKKLYQSDPKLDTAIINNAYGLMGVLESNLDNAINCFH